MTNLTGITPPAIPPQDPAKGCKCCGAELTTVLQDMPVPTETAANIYVAYQIWHVDHFSGNIFNNYDHRSNTCVFIPLGDRYGTPLPPWAPPIPMVYSSTYQCNVPNGIEVPFTEGPEMPSPGAFAAPTVCPICGRHDDSWSTYLVATGKALVQFAFPGTEPAVRKWVSICTNGHDQALPCGAFTESSSDACPMPTCPESACPSEWAAWRACIEQWRQRTGGTGGNGQ